MLIICQFIFGVELCNETGVSNDDGMISFYSMLIVLKTETWGCYDKGEGKVHMKKRSAVAVISVCLLYLPLSGKSGLMIVNNDGQRRLVESRDM